jgi:hypothetical protein
MSEATAGTYRGNPEGTGERSLKRIIEFMERMGDG